MQNIQPTCSLSILVARTDIPFMMYTIPHLVRMCNYDFLEKCLIIDVATLSGQFESRPNIGSLSDLKECCEQLVSEGVIDRVIEIDYSKTKIDQLYRKHFGHSLKHTHDFRGYPIYGIIFSLEAVQGNYILHFDSDMLLYQTSHYNWIHKGISLLEENDQVMFVSPLSGPPTNNGLLKQRGVPYELDQSGFYRFQDFTSRKFLISKKKFDNFLPIKAMWISWKRRLASMITGKNSLLTWEIMISEHLKRTNTIRADLASPEAWTLHTPDHGREFIEALPKIITKVEQGQYPAEQAGDYDLNLDLWKLQ